MNASIYNPPFQVICPPAARGEGTRSVALRSALGLPNVRVGSPIRTARNAVAIDYPAKAAELRQYSAAAQLGLLQHLASMSSQGNESETIELWRATKDSRELTCARYLPTGVDVLVFRNGELRRSQLCPTGPRRT